MVDLVLADEFDRSGGGGFLEDPDLALGQGYAESIGLSVLKFDFCLDLIGLLPSLVKPLFLLFIDIYLLYRDAQCRFDELNLFDLVIVYRGAPPKRVKMIFHKGFFFKRRAAACLGGSGPHHYGVLGLLFGDSVDVAGNELQLRIFVRWAALVVDFDRAGEI